MMPEKRMTLDELTCALETKGLGGIRGTLSPINPKTRKILEDYGDNWNEVIRKSHKRMVTPLSGGNCPKCKSEKYFKLFGGSCDKICAECKTCYDPGTATCCCH